ncbi:hypothetical protein ACTS9C_16060 [Empedobacter brevis]
MRILIFILIGTLLSFSNCATKRKTKDVEKMEVKTENIVKNDSIFQLKSKVSKIETNQTFNEFESVLKALNVQYDGDQGNDLKVILNRTERGTELNVSGKGKANYNEQSEKTYNLTKQDILAIYDSLKQVELKQNKVESGQLILDSFKSNTEKEKSDVSIWVYVLIGVIISLVIFFAWLNNQINKLNKMGGK